MPMHLVYFTAWVGDDGKLAHFRRHLRAREAHFARTRRRVGQDRYRPQSPGAGRSVRSKQLLPGADGAAAPPEAGADDRRFGRQRAGRVVLSVRVVAMAATQNSNVLTRRLIVHTVVWLVILGAILFLSAGTLDWPEAWVLLIGSGGRSRLRSHHRPPRSAAHPRTHARADPEQAKAVGQSPARRSHGVVHCHVRRRGTRCGALRHFPYAAVARGARRRWHCARDLHFPRRHAHQLICDGRRAHPGRARAPGHLDGALRLRPPPDVLGRCPLFSRDRPALRLLVRGGDRALRSSPCSACAPCGRSRRSSTNSPAMPPTPSASAIGSSPASGKGLFCRSWRA